MNNKIKSANKFGLLFTLMLVLLTACKKDEPDPEYVGTWSADQMLTIGDTQVQMREMMTLTINSFDDLMQLLNESDNKYVNYFELLGSMAVTNNIVNGTISEIGVSSFDPITGKPTGQILKYKEGTTGYDNFFAQNGQSKSFGFEFSISGNSMTVMSDNNRDGDYEDAGEKVIYAKQP